jgi:hypothetical protein
VIFHCHGFFCSISLQLAQGIQECTKKTSNNYETNVRSVTSFGNMYITVHIYSSLLAWLEVVVALCLKTHKRPFGSLQKMELLDEPLSSLP